MKFRIDFGSTSNRPGSKPCKSAYNRGLYWFVEINTLEELLALQKEVNEQIILRGDNSILIYDTWLE